MSSFNVVGTELAKTFHLNAAQLGMLASLYLYGLALSFIPAGLLLDYFSNRTLMLAALFLGLVLVLILTETHSLWLAALARFLMGTTHSIAFLGGCRLCARWLSRHMGLAIGCFVTIGLLGGIVAQTPLILLINYFGWRYALLISMGLGILIWFFMYVFLHDHADPTVSFPIDKNRHYAEKPLLTLSSICTDFSQIIFNKQNWWSALFTCLANLPIILLGEVWGILYLKHQNDLTAIQAANVVSMIYIGTIVGSPLLGFLSDQLHKRKPFMMGGAIVSLCMIIVVMLDTRLSWYVLLLLFFLIGFFTSTQTLSYAIIIKSNPNALTTRALGFACVIIMGGGGLFQPLFGWVIDHARQYNGLGIAVNNYQWAFSLLPIALLFCVILGCLIKEKV